MIFVPDEVYRKMETTGNSGFSFLYISILVFVYNIVYHCDNLIINLYEKNTYPILQGAKAVPARVVSVFYLADGNCPTNYFGPYHAW